MATILCGKCKVPVKGPSQPNASDILSCPECELSDTFEVAMKDATAFAEDHVAGQVRATLKRATAGRKNVKFKPGNRPTRSYRFILDL